MLEKEYFLSKIGDFCKKVGEIFGYFKNSQYLCTRK